MGLSARTFSGRFWALIAAIFLGFLGIGTVLPRMAPHIRYDLGGSDRTVGFVIGIFSFVALASRFVSGPLTDRKGRKTAFLVGLASCAVAGGIYLLPIGVAGAYLGRMLQGFGEACLYTGAAAWAVELGGIDRSAQALGYVSSGIWGGISSGPLVGQWLGSFTAAALMQTFTAMIAFALVYNIHEEYRAPERTGPRRLLPHGILAPGLALGFANVHYPVVTGFLILHLAKHGNSGPVAFSAYALVILFSRFFLGGLPDRIRPAITYYGGITAMAIGLVVLATAPSPIVAVLSAGLLGFGMSFPWTSIVGALLRKAPAHERGSAIGALSAFYDLFVGVSSFAAGMVAQKFGYGATFTMGAGALVFGAVAAAFVFFSVRAVTPQHHADRLEQDAHVG